MLRRPLSNPKSHLTETDGREQKLNHASDPTREQELTLQEYFSVLHQTDSWLMGILVNRNLRPLS